MLKKLFVCFLIMLNIAPVFARTVRTTRSYTNYNPYYYRPVNSNLNALERYALQRNFPRENDIQRLERLEELAFGAVQNGDLDTRYQQVENAILSRPQNNYRNSFRNNLNNYFAGQMTGFTPSIVTPGLSNPFTASYPQYGSQNIMQQSAFSPFTGARAYREIIQNQNFGTGSSVRILP